MKKTVRVEVEGYEISFLLETNKKIRLVSYYCPTKNYGDPYLPKHVYKKAINQVLNRPPHLKKIKNKK